MSFSKGVKSLIESFYGDLMVDTTLRYLPVVNLLERKGLIGAKILEVGSGSHGLTQYLPVPITGVDIRFDKIKNPLLLKVRALATNLPFKNDEFDVVVAVDVLEHIERDKRKQALHEMVRVVKKFIIINSPVGIEAYLQDKKLQAKHLENFEREHPSLKEHIKSGPVIGEEVKKFLLEEAEKLGKKLKIKVIPNLNINLHWILMRSWITKSKLLHVLDRTLWVILIPVLAKFNFGACYRNMFVVRVS